MSARTYSLKRYVNMFYIGLLILLSGTLMTVFYFSLDISLEAVSNQALESAVQEGFDYISAPGEWLEVSESFDYYVNDVHLVLYGPQETLISGILPRDFPQNLDLVSDTHRTIEHLGNEWRIYDYFRTYPNGAGIWIRGMYSMDTRIDSLQAVYRTMLWVTPLLIALVAAMGYFLTWRGFRPVDIMVDTARRIRDRHDLSARIKLPERSSSEFLELADSYNAMLESVEEAFRREKQFSGDVAHELRTPIAVMISQAEYALSFATLPETTKALESVIEQGSKISRIISQLLALSRHEDGQIPLPEDSVDFSELVELVAETLEMDAAEQEMRIETELSPGLYVQGDQTELMRVILNIASNGIKYGTPGGLLKLQLQESQAPEGYEDDADAARWLRLDVIDNGQGIAQEDQERIFQRFYQVDPSRKKSSDSSSGLGLTMSLAIARRHGGTITLDSTLGVGSRFSIYLPQIPG